MSLRRDVGQGARRDHAPVFAALGDETRLMLVRKLCRGDPLSISELSDGTRLTRQAITKHLRVLENVSLVHGTRVGRKVLFRFEPGPIEDAKGYLDLVSGQWEQTLARLKAFVESRAEPESK